VLAPGLSAHPDVVAHFRDNIKDLARLTHPRIPQIYCFGKQDKEYFVALEWCAGGSLSNELRKNGRLPLQQAIKIIKQCIDGLAAAWKLGIAHGNLKPNNIMIGEDYEIKITDFGLVSERRSSMEDTQTVSGALSFMAPELVDRGAVDFHADIYSLGIIFHYILLNRLPSHQPSATSKDDSQSSLLSPAVWTTLERMTNEDPQQRFASYDELLEAVEQLAGAYPEEPAPTVPRAVKTGPATWKNNETLFDCLAQLYREVSTGILRVNWLSVRKDFFIRQGEIVFFESNQPNESLLNLIRENNWLPPDSVLESFDADKVIGRVLQQRSVTLEEFRKNYLKLMKASLYAIFQWPVIDAEFLPAEIQNESFVTIRISDVLLDASRTLLDPDWIKVRIPLDCLINRATAFEQLLAPFPLNPEESFLAYRFQGEDITPDTLAILTGLPEDKMLRILYLLQRIGALEFRSALAAKPKRVKRPSVEPVVTRVPKTELSTKPRGDLPEVKTGGAGAPQPPVAEAPIKVLSAEDKLREAEVLFHKAEEACDSGNYGMAAHLCKEAIEMHVAPEYYQLLGAAYARHPRFQREAENAFHEAIALAPLEAEYHAVLALFYSQRNLWLRARTHCMKALEVAPKHEMATKVFRTVLENTPGQGDCWCVRVSK
jgi:serine/threonine protein kinase/Flp pilus assembly protein TadD